MWKIKFTKMMFKNLSENSYYFEGNYYFYAHDRLRNNRIGTDQNPNIVQSTEYWGCNMNKHFIVLLMYLFLLTFTCVGQEISKIRGSSWVSVDYIKEMENFLPCECFDSINYVYYISIASKTINDNRDGDEQIPEMILNYIIQTEPRQFYIVDRDSSKYVISGADENWNSKIFELRLVNDTLLLIDSVEYKKFVKSAYYMDDTYSSENIILLNKALSLRGYPSIQTILKEDSLRFWGCNAWLGNINLICSRKKEKNWVLEIKTDGYLYIQKVLNPNCDPADPIKTKVIKKLKWVINGTIRPSKRSTDKNRFFGHGVDSSEEVY
jgi:hypothetical protein